VEQGLADEFKEFQSYSEETAFYNTDTQMCRAT
jgi:hypothetical protein